MGASDHNPTVRARLCVKNASKLASVGVLSCDDDMKTLIGARLSEDATWSLGFWALQLLWQHAGPSHGASSGNVTWEIDVPLLSGRAEDMFVSRSKPAFYLSHNVRDLD